MTDTEKLSCASLERSELTNRAAKRVGSQVGWGLWGGGVEMSVEEGVKTFEEEGVETLEEGGIGAGC